MQDCSWLCIFPAMKYSLWEHILLLWPIKFTMRPFSTFTICWRPFRITHLPLTALLRPPCAKFYFPTRTAVTTCRKLQIHLHLKNVSAVNTKPPASRRKMVPQYQGVVRCIGSKKNHTIESRRDITVSFPGNFPLLRYRARRDAYRKV